MQLKFEVNRMKFVQVILQVNLKNAVLRKTRLSFELQYFEFKTEYFYM